MYIHLAVISADVEEETVRRTFPVRISLVDRGRCIRRYLTLLEKVTNCACSVSNLGDGLLRRK